MQHKSIVVGLGCKGFGAACLQLSAGVCVCLLEVKIMIPPFIINVSLSKILFQQLRFSSNPLPSSFQTTLHNGSFCIHRGKGVYGLFTGSKVQARRVLTKNLPLFLTGERILSQKT
jgi:hypothetical protein